MRARHIRRKSLASPNRLASAFAVMVALSWFSPWATSVLFARAEARGAREPPAGAVALTSAPEQKTALSLPFDGAWGVVQGMDSGST
ncbi:MAG TPA: hypothetical protein VF550_19170, partial [Polyangia bacterium]